MADNCGQFNAAALGQAQFSHIANAAAMTKGGPTMHVGLPSHTTTVPPTQLSHQFAKMSLNTNGPATTMHSMNAQSMVSSNWSSAPQQQLPQQMMNLPQQHQQQVQPQQPQQSQQPQQMFQHQQAMIQQQKQQQQMMMMMQHQQLFQQQQMQNLLQQQQQQQMIQQQHAAMIMAAQQQQQQAAMMIPQQQSPIITSSTHGDNVHEDQSQSLFDLLRNQQHEENMQNADASFEQFTDISQYLHDNTHQTYNAMGLNDPVTGGAVSQSVIDQMAQSDDPRWKNSKFVNFMQRLQRNEVEFTEDDVVETNHGDKFLNGEGDEAQNFTNDELWAKLQQEMENFQDSDEGTFGDDNQWQNEWAQYWNDSQEVEIPDSYDNLQQKIQDNIKRYTEQIPGAFERGVELFEKGDIVNAIEMFQNCTVFDPEHSMAWMYLGKSFAQLDQDNLAIQSLEKCLSIDAYNLNALLMLGVSSSNNYVTYNAGSGTYDHRNTPIQHLYNWMTTHPDYCSTVDTTNVENLIEQITQQGPLEDLVQNLSTATIKMFEDAVTVNPSDADLQTVLGVLYHINRQFDAAINAFSTAVKLQPQNAELWNKLGATIANSGKHVEATKFYSKALQLRPNYLRAKINSATAYFNLQMHHKSYPLFLDAILNSNDPKTPTCPQPHLWPLLRQSFAMCGLGKLADAASMRDIHILKAAMKDNGMNSDGSIQEGFLQPIKFDLDSF